MTDAPLGSVTSSDNKSWSAFKNIINGYSYYGMGMTVYRGELVGVMTQNVQYPGIMFGNKYTPGSGWSSSWVTLSEYPRAVGRVSIAALNDRFFLLHKAPSDVAVYLAYAYDLTGWTEVGRIGSSFTTSTAPAMVAYQGKLFIVAAGPDQAISWCTRDSNGALVTDWAKISGDYTASGLELCVHRGNLYLLHRGLDGQAFYSQTFVDGNWSAATKVVATIESGLGAASLADGTMLAAYRGQSGAVKYNVFTEGSGWGAQQGISGAYMKFEPGVASFNGQTIITYSRTAGPTNADGYVDRPLIMDEKAAAVEVDGVDREWECKWDDSSKSDQKGWIQKMLCL